MLVFQVPMALSRVILLLAVGAQVLLVSTQEGPRVVHLTQRGRALPEDRRYHDGKSPPSAEVSSETDRGMFVRSPLLRKHTFAATSARWQLYPKHQSNFNCLGKIMGIITNSQHSFFTDDRRNTSSSSSGQKLVPQIEIVYDSTGKGWVDKVKQVPDPASAPSREARRADAPRKDIIGKQTQLRK